MPFNQVWSYGEKECVLVVDELMPIGDRIGLKVSEEVCLRFCQVLEKMTEIVGGDKFTQGWHLKQNHIPGREQGGCQILGGMLLFSTCFLSLHSKHTLLNVHHILPLSLGSSECFSRMCIRNCQQLGKMQRKKIAWRA